MDGAQRSPRRETSTAEGRAQSTASRPTDAPPRAAAWLGPEWEAEATRAIAWAARSVRPIASCTPLGLAAELATLAVAWRGGREEAPRFTYRPRQSLAELEALLGRLAETLSQRGALGALYASRARELGLEAALCGHVGGPGFWQAARRRYAARDVFDQDADGLAAAWLADGPGEPARDDDTVLSDDERDGRSLVSRLRAEVGRRRLPMRVVVLPDLASVAATGEGVIQVVAGRALSTRDVERTVLHEVEGHVLPRVRAASAQLGLFALGTAGGGDDQEGRALHLEREAGFLDGARGRELALRHVAARAVERRADFVDTGRLLRGHGAPIEDALRIAARVHRGGGLARESVYLPALLRVEAALARDPGLDAVLASGRVAVEAAGELRGWVRG